MNFSSSTTTTNNDPSTNIKFSSTKTQYIAKLTWEHLNSGELNVKLSNEPFTISLSTLDSQSNHHSLEVSSSLNARLVSMGSIEYEIEGDDILIYIPKKNFLFDKEKQTINVPPKQKVNK